MKKITYSDIDSSSDFNLKNGELYINDGINLRVRVVNSQYNDNYREYLEYLPSVLDSNIQQGSNEQFSIYLGDRNLRFATLQNNNTILSIEGMNNQIICNADFMTNGWVNITNSNVGIQFGNGDTIKKNPVKWTLLADRNLTDNAVPLSTNGYATVADLFNDTVEFMVVANVEGDYVSSVIPAAAVTSFPANFTVHNGSVVVASVTFAAGTNNTYAVTSNADNVKVYKR